MVLTYPHGVNNFNPRSPHGERHMGGEKICITGYFNPRSPHGERQNKVLKKSQKNAISIHAPRTGSDSPYSSI